LFHVNQTSVAETDPDRRAEVRNLGRNIVSVSMTYGYMEQPDIRGALRELQARGEIDIPSERWIIVIGEEEIIIHDNLNFLRWIRVALFRFILRHSTPAHRFFGLDYDAGVSKEIIPVVFSREGVKIALPELEIVPAAPASNLTAARHPDGTHAEVISIRGEIPVGISENAQFAR
jgi:KUP system potassium uptake protein